MLNESQLEKNVEFLTANASPPVIYLTHLNLLQEKPDTPKMQKLWDNVQKSPSICEIFGKQREDGSWYDGSSWAYERRCLAAPSLFVNNESIKREATTPKNKDLSTANKTSAVNRARR